MHTHSPYLTIVSSSPITHIKILEEHIDSINVQMNNDKQTLLCLSMSLSVRYCSLIQI